MRAEAAFSFQTNNFGKGGKGADRVTVSVQDSAGTDNADFSTPAESVFYDLTCMPSVNTAEYPQWPVGTHAHVPLGLDQPCGFNTGLNSA